MSELAKRDAEVLAEDAELSEGDHARDGADGEEAFDGGESVGGASSSENGDAGGELFEVAGGVECDALDDGVGEFAASAHGRDGESDERGTGCFAEFSVLVHLLLGGGLEGILDWLSRMLLGELVDDTDVDGDFDAVVAGVEDVGAVGGGALSCLETLRFVLDVVVV